MHTSRQSQAGQLAVAAGLALATLACSVGLPAPTPTPTPTPVISVSLATAVPPTATASPTAPAQPEPTDTEEPPEPDDQVTAVVATGTVVASELDACALVTDEEAAALLGGPALSKTPGVDEDQGYVLNFCTWLGAGQALVVSVANTGSETDARAYIEAGQSEVEGTMTQESDVDLGPDVFWTTTERAAGYNVAYGPHALSVTLGGQVTVTDDLKAQLLKLTKAVAGRLGG